MQKKLPEHKSFMKSISHSPTTKHLKCPFVFQIVTHSYQGFCPADFVCGTSITQVYKSSGGHSIYTCEGLFRSDPQKNGKQIMVKAKRDEKLALLSGQLVLVNCRTGKCTAKPKGK